MSKKLILPAVFAVTTVSILGGLLAWRTSKQDNCNTILNSYGENHACILTNSGSMVFELYKDAAPKSIDKLKKISNEDKFYDNLEFYRVAKDFVIQGGIQDLKIKV